ncbi:MAG TPA: Ig-like domain-containing protein [Candidatus Acidoferrum sp.]|nr:Ig-like domain-containing protein [Candidatus Acidoferrum sp.]
MINDPELDEIFTDPADQEVLGLLKASPPAEPPLDPNFRGYLRAKLMTEARKTLPAHGRRSWFSFSLRPRTLAPAMAAVAAGFLVVLGVEVYLHNPSTPSKIVSVDTKAINNKTDVATAEPIRIPFSGPVDKAAVEETVQIEPATSVTKQWEGSTLVIIPNHPLAPNTNYTVTFKPAAAPPSVPRTSATSRPTVVPAPVVVHFTTVRAPIATVVPPSFRSSNLGFVADNRLAESRTIVNGTWTAAGQLLVTRPAGQAGPASASPSASTTPASKTATDVWLMSAGGAPLRLVAPGATLPATPATGNMFAAWTLISQNQARLDVFDLQGTPIASIATIAATPDRPAVWVGTDRLAYVDGGTVHLVDLHGAQIAIPTINVDKGSVAASPSGTLLAIAGRDGSVFVDLTRTPAIASPLAHPTATGFAWSAKGDLAFLIPSNGGSDLYVAADGQTGAKIASSPAGQTWSDLNWAPDAASLLLASSPNPNGSTPGTPGLVAINRDGSGQTTFGASQREYALPRWSPSGDLVLFTRHDEAGGTSFWTAGVSTTGTNATEQEALTEVGTFMQARIQGDSTTAQAQLDDSARAKYAGGTSALLSPSGTQYDRYYPVTVQLLSSNPDRFLVAVRIFSKTGATETSFFEEQLTLLQQGQRFVVDDVKASPAMQLGHGPTVVSVELVQTPPGQVVQVRFDADLKPETVTDATIEVKDRDGNAIDAKVSFDADNRLATVTVKLRPGTYQLVVTTGVTDINSMALAQEYDAPLVISR